MLLDSNGVAIKSATVPVYADANALKFTHPSLGTIGRLLTWYTSDNKEIETELTVAGQDEARFILNCNPTLGGLSSTISLRCFETSYSPFNPATLKIFNSSSLRYVQILNCALKISPLDSEPPIVIAANGQGQRVIGLNADQVDGKDAADFFPVAGGQLTGANISRNSDDSYLNIHGATGVTFGAGVTLYGRDHGTLPGNMYLTFGGYASTGKFVVRQRSASDYTNVFEIDPVGNIVTSALRLGAYVNDSYLSICAGEDGLKGASLAMYGRAHASAPGEAFLTLGGYTAYGKFTIRQRLTDESIVNLFCFDKDANFRIGGTTFGTSAARVLCVGTGTAPTSSPADAFQMYSKDITAGNAAPHFRLEGGPEIRLYQQPHIADPDADSTSLQTAVKAILVALENMRFLATS